MVAVFPKPCQPTRQRFEAPLAQELAIRHDGRAVEAQVNTNSLTLIHKLRCRQCQDNLQVPFAFALNKVGTIKARCLSKGFGRVVVKAVGANVIADRNLLSFGTRHLVTLRAEGKRRIQGFACRDTFFGRVHGIH